MTFAVCPVGIRFSLFSCGCFDFYGCDFIAHQSLEYSRSAHAIYLALQATFACSASKDHATQKVACSSLLQPS